MFFKPKLYAHRHEPIGISRECRLLGDIPEKRELIDNFLSVCMEKSAPCDLMADSIVFCSDFPQSVKRAIRQKGVSLSDAKEAFAIRIERTVTIYAHSSLAFSYALATLMQLLEKGELYCGLLYDHPLCETRGYRVFLPSRAGLDAFFKMVDFVLYTFGFC